MKKEGTISFITDTGVVLACLTAYLYFLGYVYYEGYFNEIGISHNLFKKSTREYLFASWIIPLFLIPISLTLWTFYYFNVRVSKPEHIDRVKSKILDYGGVALCLIFIMVPIFCVLYMNQQGENDAKNLLDSKPFEKITIFGAKTIPSEAYFVLFSGNRYLFSDTAKYSETTKLTVVEAGSIEALSFHKTSHTKNPDHVGGNKSSSKSLKSTATSDAPQL